MRLGASGDPNRKRAFLPQRPLGTISETFIANGFYDKGA